MLVTRRPFGVNTHEVRYKFQKSTMMDWVTIAAFLSGGMVAKTEIFAQTPLSSPQ